MGPWDLFNLLSQVRLPAQAPDVLSGLHQGEDAGVVRLSTEKALALSVDFITPVVDDPYAFGAITAANALSDLFCMGARPLAALNLLAYPTERMPPGQAARILQGALDKVGEAGAHVVGGHTVDDREVKCGLAVVGLVDPRRLIRRGGARPGDRLVLTKPIGGGVVSTALKAGEAGPDDEAEMVAVMTRLNDLIDEIESVPVSACTDITGFGLAGHAALMAQDSRVGIRIEWHRVPLLRRAWEFAARPELVPGGTLRNMRWASERVRFDQGLDPAQQALACDAMTSGGLLIAVPAPQVDRLLSALERRHPPSLAVVGEVVGDHPGHVWIRSG